MSYIISAFAVFVSILFYFDIRNYSTRIVRLIYIELLFNLIIKYIVGNTFVPSVINYVADIILVWIIFEHIYQKRLGQKSLNKELFYMLLIMLGFTIISYSINVYSPLLYLWGFRNNYRFIIFGIMCAEHLEKNDVETIMRMLYVFLLINVVVVTYQAFFINYSQGAIGDFLSGLYSNGTERGGNASLDWLMCISFTYYLVSYLNKQIKVKRLLIILLSSLYLAALCEIKIFFMQVVLISFIALFFCKKSYKSFMFLILGLGALLLGINLLYFFFPKFDNFFTIESMLDYSSSDRGYAHSDYGVGMNRMTVFSYVFNNFLKTGVDRLFGLGLGNADYSSFSFLVSDFYKKYSWTGYTFFYSSVLLIEGGIAGLILYVMNILLYMKNAIKMKVNKLSEKTVCITSAIIGILCIISIFSNQTMKLENSAYMVYSILALPFTCNKESIDNIGDIKKKESRFRMKVR